MSKPLLAKAKVVFSGVNIHVGETESFGITAREAIDLYRSLKKNLKRIKKNARLWQE